MTMEEPDCQLMRHLEEELEASWALSVGRMPPTKVGQVEELGGGRGEGSKGDTHTPCQRFLDEVTVKTEFYNIID